MLLSPFAQKRDPYAGLLDYIGDPVANMPAAPDMVAPAPPKRPGFFDRILNKFMPTETAGGLLSEEDIKNARRQGLLGLGTSLLESGGTHPKGAGPNFLQGIGRGLQAGQQAYQGAVQGNVGQQAAKQQLTLGQQQIDANNAGQARAAQLQQVRQSVIQKYGPPGEGGEAQWIDKVLPDLLAAGDEEMVGRLSEIRKSLGQDTTPKYIRSDLGDRVEYLDPRTLQVVKTDKAGATPRDVAAGLETRANVQFQRDATRTSTLAGQYNNQTKQFAQRADLYNTVLASAQDPSAAGDLSLIFAYMKLLDPGSVVREGEFATAQNTGSIPERIWAQYNKIVKDGTRLSPPQRTDFVKRSTLIAKQSHTQLQRYLKHYRQRAESMKVNPDDVAFDYFEGMFPEPAEGMSGGEGGSSTTAGPGVGSLRQTYGPLR